MASGLPGKRISRHFIGYAVDSKNVQRTGVEQALRAVLLTEASQAPVLAGVRFAPLRERCDPRRHAERFKQLQG